MKLRIEVGILFGFVMFFVSSQAIGQLTPSASSAKFPDTSAGGTSAITVMLSAEDLDGGPTVSKLSWKNGGGPFASKPSKPIPVSVHKQTPLTVSLTFSPATSGKFSDVLEVQYFYRTKGYTTAIAVSGETGCLDADDDCEPIRPICSIDKNKEPWIEQPVTNLKNTVFDALSIHAKLHNESISTYSLPGSFFYEILGLSKLFDVPSGCCSCGGPGCLPSIEFKRVKGQPTVAFFKWSIGSSTVVSSSPNPLQLSVKITLPNEVRGKAVVRASGIEYIFSNSARPSLQYDFQGETWFDGPMKCVAPGSEVIIRHGKPLGLVPTKHMIFTSN